MPFNKKVELVRKDGFNADYLDLIETRPSSGLVFDASGAARTIPDLNGTEKFNILPGTRGSGVSVISIPIVMATIANGDIVTSYTPGFAGTILKADFLLTTAVTTGSKGSTLNLEIGTTNLTGGVIALTSANCTPLGVMVAGTAVTALNTFSATETISVEASSTTTFIEGAGVLLITVEADPTDRISTSVGTGTEVYARSATGGANFKTQASTPADGDVVYWRGIASSSFVGLINAKTNLIFETQIRIASTAFAQTFGSFGLNENPTDPNPVDTAGDGAMFLYDPIQAASVDSEVTKAVTGLTTANHACWILAHKVNGTDTFTATSVTVESGRDYALRIELGSDFKATFYIDGVSVGTGPALTDGDSMTAFCGVELSATPDGQTNFDCRGVRLSRAIG